MPMLGFRPLKLPLFVVADTIRFLKSPPSSFGRLRLGIFCKGEGEASESAVGPSTYENGWL